MSDATSRPCPALDRPGEVRRFIHGAEIIFAFAQRHRPDTYDLRRDGALCAAVGKVTTAATMLDPEPGGPPEWIWTEADVPREWLEEIWGVVARVVRDERLAV